MAIFWSCVDANPSHARRTLDHNKLETVDSSEEERNEEYRRAMMLGFLLSTVDSSSEKNILIEKFQEALDKKWENHNEFANYIFKVYEDVTGRKQ